MSSKKRSTRFDMTGVALAWRNGGKGEAFRLRIDLPKYSPQFDLSRKHRAELVSALGLALDRANHKYLRNETISPPEAKQTTHHLFGVIDDGVAWLGSTIFAAGAVHFQHPFLSCFVYATPCQGQPKDLEFTAAYPNSSQEQVDHITGDWQGGQLGNLHITTIRDFSGEYIQKEAKHLKQANMLNKEKVRENPIFPIPGDHAQQFIHMTARLSELRLWRILTKKMKIGGAENVKDGLVYSNFTSAELSDEGLMRKISENLENSIHVFDLRSKFGCWSGNSAMELSVLIYSNDEDGREILTKGNSCSFLHDGSQDADLIFAITNNTCDNIPPNTTVLFDVRFGHLPHENSESSLLALRFTNKEAQVVFDFPGSKPLKTLAERIRFRVITFIGKLRKLLFGGEA